MKTIDKNKTVHYMVLFIIVLVYNIVVFVIPFKREGGFWTGYIFSMISIILSAGVSLFAFRRDGLKSKIYKISLFSVALYYLAVQLIVGLLEMILLFIPYKYGIALNVILLAACLLGLISADIATDEIERIDETIKEKVFFIKSLQADVETLADKADDDSVRKILKELAETIRYSDPMSSPKLAVIENRIEVKAATLAEAVEKRDTSGVMGLYGELQQLFVERNRKCKILK